MKIDRIGEKYIFEDDTFMEIIEYYNAKNITIKFNDGTIVKNIKYYRFSDGAIKNRNTPCVYGIGYVGYGEFLSEKDGKSNILYSKWSKMMQRCYSNEYHLKKPTYKDCSVHPDWHNFQNFAKWAEKQYVEGFELDKDILVKGNKVYSAETCCFVPREINSMLTHNKTNDKVLPIGVFAIKNKFRTYMNFNGKLKLIGYFHTIESAFMAYKEAKESQIKIVANKYKNEITNSCYKALMNLTISIND